MPFQAFNAASCGWPLSQGASLLSILFSKWNACSSFPVHECFACTGSVFAAIPLPQDETLVEEVGGVSLFTVRSNLSGHFQAHPTATILHDIINKDKEACSRSSYTCPSHDTTSSIFKKLGHMLWIMGCSFLSPHIWLSFALVKVCFGRNDL